MIMVSNGGRHFSLGQNIHYNIDLDQNPGAKLRYVNLCCTGGFQSIKGLDLQGLYHISFFENEDSGIAFDASHFGLWS